MLGELGHYALNLALLVAVIQSIVPLVGAHRDRGDWMAVARPAAFAQLALVLFAFIILTHAFVVQDRSLQYVADNSNSLLPLIYRYTAVWGAHEGSLLLWLLVLAVSAILTVQVLGVFEGTLAQVTVLSLFIPLLTGTGG